MNDDGTAQTEFYGNNSFTPFSLFHAVAIPGSSLALAIAGGHHVDQSGRLVLIDRSKGTQENEGLEYAAPRSEVVPAMVDFYAKKGELFQYPCAVDKDNYLVSYVPEGGPERSRYAIPFGIYWMDNDGSRELLAFDPAIHCGQIVPIKTRSRLPEREPNVDLGRSSGVFYVQDVYFGPGVAGAVRCLLPTPGRQRTDGPDDAFVGDGAAGRGVRMRGLPRREERGSSIGSIRDACPETAAAEDPPALRPR